MKILDLDDKATWEKSYCRFLKNDPSWCFIEDALSQNEDEKINKVFLEMENSIEYVQSPEILSLRHRCTDHFKNSYTHVAAYHACRPTNIHSYLQEGIVPANTQNLIEKAKVIFENEVDVNNAIKDIGTDYLNHGREKVGLFFSRSGSLESGYTQYLNSGSELLKNIAGRIGDWAVQKLSSQGSPTLFRCAIPISWLEEHTTFSVLNSYALEPIRQLLIRLRWPHKKNNTIRGAFLLKRSIPKEYILEHIDMSPFMKQGHEV